MAECSQLCKHTLCEPRMTPSGSDSSVRFPDRIANMRSSRVCDTVSCSVQPLVEATLTRLVVIPRVDAVFDHMKWTCYRESHSHDSRVCCCVDWRFCMFPLPQFHFFRLLRWSDHDRRLRCRHLRCRLWCFLNHAVVGVIPASTTCHFSNCNRVHHHTSNQLDHVTKQHGDDMTVNNTNTITVKAYTLITPRPC